MRLNYTDKNQFHNLCSCDSGNDHVAQTSKSNGRNLIPAFLSCSKSGAANSHFSPRHKSEKMSSAGNGDTENSFFAMSNDKIARNSLLSS